MDWVSVHLNELEKLVRGDDDSITKYKQIIESKRVICEFCGEPFFKSTMRQKYCSKLCSYKKQNDKEQNERMQYLLATRNCKWMKDLKLPDRLIFILLRANISTYEDLENKTFQDLCRIRGLGMKSICELIEKCNLSAFKKE